MTSTLSDVLNILEGRDIPLGKDDIAWAFDHAESNKALTAWAAEYLTPQTLLTKAERNFAESHQLIGTQSDLKARPLSDLEIEAAITSIEASTAAIENQCQVLEAQKKYLKQITARHGARSLDSDQNLADLQHRKFTRDRAQIDLEADELAQNLSTKLQAATKQIETVRGKSTANVERVLEKDDRLLGGLQKVVPRLGDCGDQYDNTHEVEQLCAALTLLTVKEIHLHLNSTYNSTLQKQSKMLNQFMEDDLSPQQTKQRETLRAELEELSGEIEGLVAIAIDNKYRKPLRRATQVAQAESREQKLQWTEYTTMTLQWLAARMEILGEHVQHLQGHHTALSAISDILQHVAQTSRQGAGESTNAAGPGDKSMAKGLKPLRLVQANLSESQDPIFQLLRQLDVRISEAPNGGAVDLYETLGPVLQERREKLQQLTQTTDETITEVVSSSLDKTDTHLQDVLAAVYAPSKYRSIRLVDTEVQRQSDRLERDTQAVGDAMRMLDVDAVTRAVQTKQSELVGRLA